MKPYADSLDHLEAELARIGLLFRLHFDEAGGGADMDGPTEGFDGLSISEREIERLLQPDHEQPTNDVLRQRIDELGEQIDARITSSRDAGVSLRLASLADNFALSRAERDAFLLALAPELDEKYGTMFSYLRDNISQKRPTVGLVLRMLCRLGHQRFGAMTLFSTSEPLRDERLVRLVPETQELPRLEQSVYVDRHVVEFLLGSDAVDDSLPDSARLVSSTTRVADIPLEPATRDRLNSVVKQVEDRPAIYYVHGPAGSGRGRAAAAIATALDCQRLRVDSAEVAATDPHDTLARLEREARLFDAALQFDDVDVLTEGDDALDAFVSHLDSFSGHVFLTGHEPWMPNQRVPDHAFTTVQIQRPSSSLRNDVWSEYADELPENVDTDVLASKFSLTPGEIETAMHTARALTNGHGLTQSAVYRGCRAQSTGTLDDLAQKIDTTYTWEDIVLPDEKRIQLHEVSAHVNHRGTVYSDWGFGEKFSLGSGLTILFSGPSGTGKTMAAEIIANEAGLGLYKIDIASVVSKYIGETETNLGVIFDEAEHSNAILLFDEADALFGQRSEVSNAQDRYANVEVNYLLQRIEDHDGTIILTTNLEQNIDDAFQRRLDVSVDFPRPDARSRQAIWESVFPPATPVDDIDFEFFSTFDVTGGNIKNIAQTAAFLAADDSGTVEMQHLVTATKLELQKIGKLINPSDFGEYSDLLVRD